MLIVSLGSTTGLRLADEQLAESLRRAGAEVTLERAARPAERRTLMLTDLAWAWAARRAAERALRRSDPRAIVFSSTTAAMFWPRPGAIRFDAPAAGNRPGRHGLWQRPLERRRLREATLLLPYSDGALAEAGQAVAGSERIVLPPAVEPSGEDPPVRDITAITYAADPLKKGLDRVLSAWATQYRSRGGEDGAALGELLVAGAEQQALAAAGIRLEGLPGVRDVGRLPAAEYRALCRRAKVFVCAPRREDHGAAQLEALMDGCLLVSTPAPGPYAALAIARRLDERLVGDDLPAALGHALEHADRDDYAARARRELEAFSRAAVDARAAEALERLLGRSEAG